MPKLLRSDEKITFVQTRAPTEMWRDVKASAIKVASDGTATRLCTNGMLEYLKLRRWAKGEPWLRPQDLARKAGATGFQQVNLPLSNMDEEGHIIASRAYLERQGVLDLFSGDKHVLRDALHTGAFSKLIYVAAEQLEISGATFAYTFLHWLHNTKCKPALASIAAHEQKTMAAATAFVRDDKPRRKKAA
jgi:hypothetical protein